MCSRAQYRIATAGLTIIGATILFLVMTLFIFIPFDEVNEGEKYAEKSIVVLAIAFLAAAFIMLSKFLLRCRRYVENKTIFPN
ncbi:MAG TPA: hypothetical protein PKZ97_01935 [Azospirillaceae bacterium]|nr:hypothetical protein [Azospirillaceae bacterium]HRQ79856.1 hypothetical protein [Azospirillaceae bacterium]